MQSDQHQQQLLRTLAQQGFEPPESWLEYAIQHNLRRIPAVKLDRCPDCEAPTSRRIGQYVYYCHLVSLRQCDRCGLLYTDTRFADEVIRRHFESNYKEPDYFVTQRRRIFDQITKLAGRRAPPRGSVLDIGGATGHLMARLQAQRPDLRITVNDLSASACETAAREFGFATLPGDIGALAACGRSFDVVIMSDVIYYEPDLKALWRQLPRLVAEGGTLLIRIPNKLALIKLSQALRERLQPQRARHAERIPLFNPEHLFIFPRHFLVQRLAAIGFHQVRGLPSALLGRGGRLDLLTPAWGAASRLGYSLTGERLIVSPAQLIVATREYDLPPAQSRRRPLPHC